MEAKLAQGSIFASIHFHKSLGSKFPYNSKQRFETERTLLQQDRKLINVLQSQYLLVEMEKTEVTNGDRVEMEHTVIWI